MANPRPTPKPENLRPPWPTGTSGNPAGYSRGRQISDAIERLIEEMALDREFGATAIAMALGRRTKGATHNSLLPECTWPRSCDRENLNPVESLISKNGASAAYKRSTMSDTESGESAL